MNYDFFLKYNDISDYEIKGLFIDNNQLFLDVIMPIRLELIANGYRPELDMEQEKTFIFSIEACNTVFSNKAKIKFLNDSIIINNIKYALTSHIVKIK